MTLVHSFRIPSAALMIKTNFPFSHNKAIITVKAKRAPKESKRYPHEWQWMLSAHSESENMSTNNDVISQCCTETNVGCGEGCGCDDSNCKAHDELQSMINDESDDVSSDVNFAQEDFECTSCQNDFDSDEPTETIEALSADENMELLRQKLDTIKQQIPLSQVSRVLQDKSYRQNIYHKLQTGLFSVLKHLFRNLQEGEVGKRGEENLIAQVFLIGSVLFVGVHPLLRWALSFSGVVSFVTGLYLLFHGLSDLGELTTVFAPPVAASQVVSHGVYRLVRHPIYGGLLLLCMGVSVTGMSVHKLLLTLILAVVLVSSSVFFTVVIDNHV